MSFSTWFFYSLTNSPMLNKEKPRFVLNHVGMRLRIFQRHRNLSTIISICALLSFTGAQVIVDDYGGGNNTFIGEIHQVADPHDVNIDGSTTPATDVTLFPTSNHNIFGDGNKGHVIGDDVDSDAADSCNEVDLACSTEEGTFEVVNGSNQNDEGETSGGSLTPISISDESLSIPSILKGSSRDPDQQQTDLVLAKAQQKSKKTPQKKSKKTQQKKSKKSPTSNKQNTKLMICHIPSENPSACRDMSIHTSDLQSHLAHGDLQGKCDEICDSFCDRVGTCSGLNMNKCTCCGCKKECYKGTRDECGVGKVSICRCNAALNTYETVCMDEVSVSGHLGANPSDYYGKCEEEIFVKNSVLMNVPPEKGTEDIDLYSVDYDVSYNKDGIVVLSKSFEIIDGVLCSSHQVDILFSKPLVPGSLPSMFPKWAILVVDGNFFGTKCDFSSRNEGGREQPSNFTFLVIESSQVDGSTVTISGVPTVLDSMFEKQNMHYQMNSSGNQQRRLSTFVGEVKVPPTLKPEERPPVQFVAKARISVTASADFHFNTEWVRMGDIFSLDMYYPKIEVTALVDFHCIIEIQNSLKLTEGEIKCPGSDWCPDAEYDVIPDIFIAAVPVPNFLLKFLNSKSIRLGLMFTFPFALELKLESSFNHNINLGKGTLDLGEKRVRLGISHFPLTGLFGTSPIWEVLKNTGATFIPDKVPEQDPDPYVSDDAILKVEARFGIAPQVRLDSWSFAWVSVGTFFGIETTLAFKYPPYGPTEGAYCDKCHFIRSDVDLVVRDLFLKYKKYKENVVKKVLIAGYLKFNIFRLCLLGLMDAIGCGGRCCRPGHKCVANVCQAPGLCTDVCCSDIDCVPPRVCNLSKKQCQCPYECCADGDCTNVGEFCDGVTHQCTNASHDIHKQPHKIVHIGDAFSSGSGAKAYVEPQSCFRSSVNWGMHFSKTRGDHLAVTYVNRASDGAVMKDYFEKKYLGDLSLTSEGCPASKGDELIVKDGTGCKRYVQAQQNAITSDVELVLMTFGGHHFRRLVLLCFVTGFIKPQACKDTLVEARNYATTQLKGDLINILLDVASRMKPGGKVLFSTYPHLIADVEYIIGSTEGGKFDARTAVRDLATLIDRKQQDAINEANSAAVSKGGLAFALFFDRTKDVFAGHEPKPGILEASDNLWINDSAAVFLSEEWYHPNDIGHKKWAEAIAKFFDGKVDGGGGGSTNSGANNVDLVFVIDATNSMAEEIGDVKISMADLTNLIANTSKSYRIAIVTYRDVEAESEYPSKLNLDFTNDLVQIQGAIDGIELRSGGSTWPETTLSGLNTALGLQFRPGVTKLIISMGDEPPLMVDGKEPVTGLTVESIVKKSNELDPVKVMAVNVGVAGHMDNTAINDVTSGTGGSIIELGTGGVVQAIKSILENTSRQPFAWFGEKIVARTGDAMMFDASGSFDPFGLPITSYEWDFNGDNVIDVTTKEAATVYTYNNPFDGYAILRVKSAAGVGVATAHVIVNDDGSVPQLGPKLCEIDVVSGLPILEDATGNQLYCLTDSSMWPIVNKPGVIVIVKDNQPMIHSCLEVFSLPSIVNLQPCDARNKMRITKRQVEIGDYSSACNSMGDLIKFTGKSGYACVEMCRNLNPSPSPTSKSRTKKQTKPITSPTIKPTKRLK